MIRKREFGETCRGHLRLYSQGRSGTFRRLFVIPLFDRPFPMIVTIWSRFVAKNQDLEMRGL